MAFGIMVIKSPDGDVRIQLTSYDEEKEAHENFEVDGGQIQKFMSYPGEGENEHANALLGLYFIPEMAEVMDDLISSAFEAGREHECNEISDKVKRILFEK